jgi:putative flippase GtrA
MDLPGSGAVVIEVCTLTVAETLPPEPRLFMKVGKSLVVSAITTVLSLTVLGVLTFTEIVPAMWANVIATVVGIGPSYALNRRWVWRRNGRSSLRNEVAPFWSMCLFALVASTWTVAAAARWAQAMGLDDVARTGVVLSVNVVTFAVLWLLQFLLLDRVLFASTPESQP